MIYFPEHVELDRSLTCPWCGVFTRQRASELCIVSFGNSQTAKLEDRRILFLDCDACKKRVLYADDHIIYPEPPANVPPPNPDLHEDIKKDYLEAAVILSKSPRGAAALLRLCLMNLMTQLQLSGDLNADIRELVRKGLDARVQQACDLVRVIGNSAVHPGKIDLRDNAETAHKLFSLVNFIADQTITQPKHRESLFDELVPKTVKDQIRKRDET